MNAREMTGKFQDWQKRAGETARDWQKRAGERARDWSEATDEYVHENTWTTIAIATAVGCLLGYLLAGRRED
jgi:ElaB/YqjD/DUF883 family membrane-anchored ribosome-binding protein